MKAQSRPGRNFNTERKDHVRNITKNFVLKRLCKLHRLKRSLVRILVCSENRKTRSSELANKKVFNTYRKSKFEIFYKRKQNKKLFVQFFLKIYVDNISHRMFNYFPKFTKYSSFYITDFSVK